MKKYMYLLVSMMLLLGLSCLVACDGNGDPADTTLVETTAAETTVTETTVTETTVAETTAAVTETDTTPETTEAATTEMDTSSLSPEEIQHLQDVAYLESVTYLNFELTGDDKPYYVGRWFEKSIVGIPHMMTTTDGSHLYFMVEGAEAIQLTFSRIHEHTTPYYSFSIDGETPVRRLITNGRVDLPDTGRHTIRIIADGLTDGEKKWANEAGFALKSIETDGRMVGIKPTNPVVFYYGDSITEGIMALGTINSSQCSSATNAYPWATSTALGVVPYFVGYSATGLIQTGSFNTCLNAIDYLSETRTVESSTVANITPDLIVVNHGVNDVYDNRNPVADVVAALEATIERLQAKYPGVKIIYVVPFWESQDAGVVALGEAADQLATEYDNLAIVHTKDWEISYTDGIHPNSAGAAKVGQYLSEAIVNIVGEDFFN